MEERAHHYKKIQGFGLEYSELREYTHGFFSNVAEILDDSFAQVWISFSQIDFLTAFD